MPLVSAFASAADAKLPVVCRNGPLGYEEPVRGQCSLSHSIDEELRHEEPARQRPHCRHSLYPAAEIPGPLQ